MGQATTHAEASMFHTENSMSPSQSSPQQPLFLSSSAGAVADAPEVTALTVHACVDSADTAGGGVPHRTLHSDGILGQAVPVGAFEGGGTSQICMETLWC